MLNADVLAALKGMVTAALPDFNVHSLDPAGNPAFYADPELSTALDSVLDSNKQLFRDGRLAFAIADLTDDPKRGFGLNKPAYAGFNDAIYGTVASMAKLLPLYAAYQLRCDLRQYLLQEPSIGDINTLASRARLGYGILGTAENIQNIPLVEKIFTSAGSGATGLDFQRGNAPGSDLNDIDGATIRNARTGKKLRDTAQLIFELSPPGGDRSDDQLYFFDQLRLMACWSNDISAGVVIESLGFPYLWQVARKSDLFRVVAWPAIGAENTDGTRGGLFLAADYTGTKWITRRSGWSLPPPGAQPCTGGPEDPTQGGTARSAALLMTRLAQNRLFGDDGSADPGWAAHDEIREILRKNFADPVRQNPDGSFAMSAASPERGAPSPLGANFLKGARSFGWTLSQDPWPGDASPAEWAVSKLGLLLKGGREPPHVSDAVLVRAGRGSPAVAPITAVLVGINRRDCDATCLNNFGQQVAQLLKDRHPS